MFNTEYVCRHVYHLVTCRLHLPGVHLSGDSARDLLEDLKPKAHKQLVHGVGHLLLFSSDREGNIMKLDLNS